MRQGDLLGYVADLGRPTVRVAVAQAAGFTALHPGAYKGTVGKLRGDVLAGLVRVVTIVG